MSKIRDMADIAYYPENILGPVSQTGGLPTGAIIESGSNSNGRYVKYADGTLLCRMYHSSLKTMSNISGGPAGMVISPVIALTTPAIFSSGVIETTVSGSGGDSSSYGWITGALTSSNSINIVYYSTGGTGDRTLYLYIQILGRWY